MSHVMALWGRTWSPAVLAGNVVYLLTTFPVAVALFVISTVLLATSIGLAITIVGLPLLAVTLALLRWTGGFERARVRLLLRFDVAEPPPLGRSGGVWAKTKRLVRDGLTWRSTLYALLLLPLATATFVVTVTLITTAVGLATYPLYAWALPVDGRLELGDEQVVDAAWEIAVAGLVGAALLAVTPPLLHLVARGHALLVRTLLGGTTAQLRARVEEVTRTRSEAVAAAAAERRRIERDLHDGAQQQLIAVAMDLGRARERFAADPAAAESLVIDAHEGTKRAIADLRSLARGIHPAILGDRGLDAALSGAAARSPVPVTMTVSVPGRLSPNVESTAYFVVAEALANVAKHAGASAARVAAAVEDGRLVVEVSDDGHGGAAAHAGGGLEGIAARVAALDGTLTLTSPRGGPSVVRAELPCA